MCAADARVVDQQVRVGRPISDRNTARSQRRLRDLVLVGLHASPLLSYDSQRSVSESVERRLHEGYRYLELDVRLGDDGLFYWSADLACTSDVHQDISPALLAVASFSQQFSDDIFVLRFVLENDSFFGSQLLETICACIGSRSVLATDAFQSTVDEILSTQRNVVVLVKNLSSMLPLDVSLAGLPDIFVEDNSVRNETDVDEWNVVDRGGSLLEQHRSVDTLSALTLRWQGRDPSTTSILLSDVCQIVPSWLLPLTVAGAVLCWVIIALTRSRCSVYKTYCGLAAASAVMMLLLALRPLSNGSSVTVGSDSQLVNSSCTAVVNAAQHWLARPSRYRLNVFIVDHRKYCCSCACSTSPTSGLAGLAAAANAGRVRRAVLLRHAGSPLSDSGGLRAIFACPAVLFAYVVTSRDEGHVVAWNQLSVGDVVNFEEGEFPMDATVAVYVATVWNRWLHVSRSPCL